VNLYRDEIPASAVFAAAPGGAHPVLPARKVSAGRDVRGIKRVYQFEKVEMFVFCEPEHSEEEFQLLVQRARLIPELLGLPYRVVALCSGDTGFNASKTYDIELWAPGQGDGSRSAALPTASTSRPAARTSATALERRLGAPPHLLNASGLAPGRTLISVLENYQQEDGSIVIPEVLRPTWPRMRSGRRSERPSFEKRRVRLRREEHRPCEISSTAAARAPHRADATGSGVIAGRSSFDFPDGHHEDCFNYLCPAAGRARVQQEWVLE
jgi:hypothetical protein